MAQRGSAKWKKNIADALKGPVRLCACGCGKPTITYYYHGTFKGYGKYILGHAPRRTSSKRQQEAARAYHFKHGESPSRNGKKPTPEYRAWRAMIDRCYRTKDKPYKNYGGRGIKVCDRWRHDFLAFLADMGRKPSPELTLDRFPNNNGNYEPGNCRWATRKEQYANSRPRQKKSEKLTCS